MRGASRINCVRILITVDLLNECFRVGYLSKWLGWVGREREEFAVATVSPMTWRRRDHETRTIDHGPWSEGG